ncbi:hypothetical protein HK102_004657 [Quaeritorhiza haematococci]|nr:hypothetical protein HK102_004657 [Quaeritorhiza haematococci]
MLTWQELLGEVLNKIDTLSPLGSFFSLWLGIVLGSPTSYPTSTWATICYYLAITVNPAAGALMAIDRLWLAAMSWNWNRSNSPAKDDIDFDKRRRRDIRTLAYAIANRQLIFLVDKCSEIIQTDQMIALPPKTIDFEQFVVLDNPVVTGTMVLGDRKPEETGYLYMTPRRPYARAYAKALWEMNPDIPKLIKITTDDGIITGCVAALQVVRGIVRFLSGKVGSRMSPLQYMGRVGGVAGFFIAFSALLVHRRRCSGLLIRVGDIRDTSRDSINSGNTLTDVSTTETDYFVTDSGWWKRLFTGGRSPASSAGERAGERVYHLCTEAFRIHRRRTFLRELTEYTLVVAYALVNICFAWFKFGLNADDSCWKVWVPTAYMTVGFLLQEGMCIAYMGMRGGYMIQKLFHIGTGTTDADTSSRSAERYYWANVILTPLCAIWMLMAIWGELEALQFVNTHLMFRCNSQ